MTKIRKYQVIAFLEAFEYYGCKTIKDIKESLNKDLEKDTDVVFQWKVFATKKDFEVNKNDKEN